MEQPRPGPNRSEDIAAAMEAIRTLAKAPPPTPGVVDLVIAQLDFITQRIPDSGLQDASIEVARHVAEVHELFKSHIRGARPSLDVDKVATGETWLGTRALELGLVDALQTSDSYLMSARHDKELLAVRYIEKKNVIGTLSSFVSAALHVGEKRRQEQQSQLLM